MVILLPGLQGSLAEPGLRVYSLRPGKHPVHLIMGFIKREDQ